MNDKILAIEIKLLLARYGRKKIIEALSVISEQPLEKIEQEVNEVTLRKKNIAKRPPKSIDELVAGSSSTSREQLRDVTILAQRYVDRRFLPELRQVERFLDHSHIKHGKLKSRKSALPKVIQALAAMSSTELSSLVRTTTEPDESAFSLLADEIMGKHRGH